MLAADEKVDGKSLINAGYTAYPSGHFRIPEDIEKVKRPPQCSCGSEDERLPLDKAVIVEATLEGNKDGHPEFVMYEGGGQHGFAVQGSKEDPGA